MLKRSLHTALFYAQFVWVAIWLYAVTTFLAVDSDWYKSNQALIDYYDTAPILLAYAHFVFLSKRYYDLQTYIVQGHFSFLVLKWYALNSVGLKDFYALYYLLCWVCILYPIGRIIKEKLNYETD